MLIVDSTVAPRLVAGNKREQQNAKIQEWCDAQLDASKFLTLDPSNYEKQLGRGLHSHEFENILLTISPNFVFANHPTKTSKKAIYHLRNGKKHYVCPYENGFMPEHSVLRRAEERVLDLSVGVPGAPPIQRCDLPRHEWVPGEGYVWDKTQTQPGFKNIEIMYGEHFRGWRTILIRLVQSRSITPEQAERAFGVDTTAAWAHHLGKQRHELPW